MVRLELFIGNCDLGRVDPLDNDGVEVGSFEPYGVVAVPGQGDAVKKFQGEVGHRLDFGVRVHSALKIEN